MRGSRAKGLRATSNKVFTGIKETTYTRGKVSGSIIMTDNCDRKLYKGVKKAYKQLQKSPNKGAY